MQLSTLTNSDTSNPQHCQLHFTHTQQVHFLNISIVTLQRHKARLKTLFSKHTQLTNGYAYTPACTQSAQVFWR